MNFYLSWEAIRVFRESCDYAGMIILKAAM